MACRPRRARLRRNSQAPLLREDDRPEGRLDRPVIDVAGMGRLKVGKFGPGQLLVGQGERLPGVLGAGVVGLVPALAPCDLLAGEADEHPADGLPLVAVAGQAGDLLVHPGVDQVVQHLA